MVVPGLEPQLQAVSSCSCVRLVPLARSFVLCDSAIHRQTFVDVRFGGKTYSICVKCAWTEMES